jgi:uncharacterized membrane protein
MSESDKKIEELQTRLENLLKQQEYFQREISQMRYEINTLRNIQQKRASISQEPQKQDYIPPKTVEQIVVEVPQPEAKQTFPFGTNYAPNQQTPNYQVAPPQPKDKSDVEKFIGENLAATVGILITVIGVFIGAKYAIDNNLISPLMRIVFGYLVGFGLLGFGVKLKENYRNFSAVLVSGAMAIMYFVTFAAYNYYGLFSQESAFALMVIITVSTVAAAISFNRQIIAHLGMVGAYSIPFLLSENSGRVEILFSYIAIINVGILAVSVKKYWKTIHYLSFFATWLIFLFWLVERYRADEHFGLAWVFASIYFLTFYLTFTLYKIITEAELSFDNVLLILANSFIYFGIGYGIIDEKYHGLFAVGNALVHFFFAFALDRFKPFERNTIYLFSALMLTFCTIAVPVQLDGSAITLLWAAEAVILFAIGRTRQIPLYEHFSYPLMILAFFSLWKDWAEIYFDYFSRDLVVMPVFNPYFLTGILFVAAFAVIYRLNKNPKYPVLVSENLYIIFYYAIPAIALFALYNTLRLEIGNYFYARKTVGDSAINNQNLELFNVIWQINYTMLFLTVLSFVNIKRLQNTTLAYVNIALNALMMFIFLTAGLLVLSELRSNYLNPIDGGYVSGSFNIIIRYISYAFFIGLLSANYQYLKQTFWSEKLPEKPLTMLADFTIHFSAIWLLSSELLHWRDILGFDESIKFGLSILWGLYALFLVGLGIAKHRKHLRIGAIVLFALTLVKLFFYDIIELGTISKTIIFVSLGILLLLISFLYNKYKHLIFEEAEI